MIDTRVVTEPRIVSSKWRDYMSLRETSTEDERLMKIAAHYGGYVQIRNGVRVLMVPKDANKDTNRSS